MVWVPVVVDENVYVADPFESARDEVAVTPSTTIVKVPVGVPETEVDAEDTVIVMASLAPELGVVVAAKRVVVEVAREDPVVGHAVSRL